MRYLTSIVFFLVTLTVGAQISSFESQYADVENELSAWDTIRGKWLSASIQALASNEPIPDRNFPEDFSPLEMLALVPQDRLSRIQQISQSNSTNNRDLLAKERWNRIEQYTRRPNCNPSLARTYGDPHLKSFDGAEFSFQTVGEFVMCKADNGQFEVQTRQRPEGDDFSLNSAVAMQMSGDRIGFYPGNMPDGSNADVRVNGQSVYLSEKTYFLPRGGTIQKSGNNFHIVAPTGEKVRLDVSGFRRESFINLAIELYPCSQTNYKGVLGNANGNRNDDFVLSGSSSSAWGGIGEGDWSDRIEREHAAFLSRDFANQWRVTNFTTLFEYRMGESTANFTDVNFPRNFRTIEDLSKDQRDRVSKQCRDMGFTGRELNACIFDQGFLDIPPSPKPVITDRTKNVVLSPVDKPEPNVNPRNVRPAKLEDGAIKENNSGAQTRPVEDKEPTKGFGVKDSKESQRPVWNGEEGKPSREEPASPVKSDRKEPTRNEPSISVPDLPEKPRSSPAPSKPRVEPPRNVPTSIPMPERNVPVKAPPVRTNPVPTPTPARSAPAPQVKVPSPVKTPDRPRPAMPKMP